VSLPPLPAACPIAVVLPPKSCQAVACLRGSPSMAAGGLPPGPVDLRRDGLYRTHDVIRCERGS
jgi:hypothetical protein